MFSESYFIGVISVLESIVKIWFWILRLADWIQVVGHWRVSCAFSSCKSLKIFLNIGALSVYPYSVHLK